MIITSYRGALQSGTVFNTHKILDFVEFLG